MLTLSVNRLAADVQSALGHKIQLHHLSAKPVNYSIPIVYAATHARRNQHAKCNCATANWHT